MLEDVIITKVTHARLNIVYSAIQNEYVTLQPCSPAVGCSVCATEILQD